MGSAHDLVSKMLQHVNDSGYLPSLEGRKKHCWRFLKKSFFSVISKIVVVCAWLLNWNLISILLSCVLKIYIFFLFWYIYMYIFYIFCIFIKKIADKEVALIVNNLGGTSNLELTIVAQEAVQILCKFFAIIIIYYFYWYYRLSVPFQGCPYCIRANLYACFMPCLIQLFFEKFITSFRNFSKNNWTVV